MYKMRQNSQREGELVPRVSVIVPIYNVEGYLSQCLDSILAQSLDDIEVVCVNDGSTDSSLEIINGYAKRDKRIIAVSQENGGYGKAMNTGVDFASGEYISIVEPDDFIDRDMLKTLYEAAQHYGAQVVKSDFYEFSQNQKRARYRAVPTSSIYYNKPLCARDDKEIFNFKMNTWTGLYRLDFLKEYKIRHNETRGASYQDNGFWFQTVMHARRIVFVNRAFYRYRQDNPSSSINSKGKVFAMCEEYEFIRSILQGDKSLFDEYIGSYQRAKFYNYLYTYRRIGEEYRAEFLERFSCELNEADKNGELAKIDLPLPYMRELERIMKNPSEVLKSGIIIKSASPLQIIRDKGIRYTIGKIAVKMKEKMG